MAFRFVTVFGQGSDLSCWPSLRSELNRQNIFFSTNIDKIRFESIFKSPSEILENVRHNACIGVILLVSDNYFSYLDAQAASEKEVLLDHIQHKRHIFSVLAAESVTERPEFNIIRSWHHAQNPDALALDLRAWLQEPGISSRAAIDFHPDINTILRVTCGPSLEDVSGLVSKRADGINYNLYRYRDPIMGSRNFVVYLHPDTVIARTADHLKSNFELTIQSDPLLVIADPKKVSNRETWLRTIKNQFRCTNALFLDDFIQQKFSLTLSPPMPPARAVLSPRSRLANDDLIIGDSFVYFTAFIERSMEDLPIVVIRGQGGIGKTTFSKHLQRLISGKVGTELVVLSAPDVIKEITENPEVAANFTLFNLLRSMFPTREMSALGEQEFAWIFDTGRLSIVIDGIDEIIPRLPTSASMHVLFASIVRYSNYLRRGKIFLTCRNNALLSDFSGDAKLEEYDLLPFDTSQVSQFIEDRFPGMRLLQQKAYQFLDEVKFTSDDGILPFVLRIACDSVQNSLNATKADLALETSDVLALNRKLDHIIYKVCEREEAKYEYSRFLGRNSVDSQCLFFIQLALVDRGQCSRTRMELFFKAYSSDIDRELLSRLAGHPLLESHHDLLTFAYDVIGDFFQTLGFHRGVTGLGGLEFLEVDHLADLCRINSPFLEEVAARIDKLSDEIILTISDYVVTWYADLSKSGSLEEYYRCASALFNTGLQFLCKRHGGDVGRLTEYMASVFKHAGDDDCMLKGVALHNIPENSR